ncbi:MAG: BTAD domain-containing putative transcriptional regulator, partial [Acidimicrobiales bacterium]
MHFRALGPLEVIRDGEVVDLGPLKQRSLLALLLIQANEVVSTDRIIEELWGPDAEGKENALWVYVSRLRSALEPDRVERGESKILLRRDPGYMLCVDEGHYDVGDFERLLREGRTAKDGDPEAGAALISEALETWRGGALDDFQYEAFAQTEIARLEEERITALEDRVEADLACGLSGELVSELEALREHYPLRERLVGHLMVALYRSGRPADGLRAYGRFRQETADELGIEPSPELRRLEEQILLHDEELQRIPRSSDEAAGSRSDVANPFKGLLPFVEADNQTFFGRDSLVAEMLRLIGGGQRLLGIVGSSGSGKSSVVRAGLIPALNKGAVADSQEWLVARMVPGSHPFAELEAALLRSTLDAPDSLDDQLRDDSSGLLRAVLRILPEDDARLVLVIDQFEELFTLVESEQLRNRFLSNLVTALDDPHGRVSIVLTLRADFYGRPLNHPEFGARLSGSVVNVTTLSAEELEAAAVQPAATVGVEFEPALLGQLIADVGGQPGALPLFQYSLTELFDRRIGNTLMADTYREMGGVKGALSRRASDLYDQLDEQQRGAAKQLFLRLVNVSQQDERTRRRVEASEIVDLDVDVVAMQHVIGQFGKHRLLSFDANRLTGAPTVEVAHEALLDAWPELRDWVDESRDDIRKHASFTLARDEWKLAERNPDYLPTGSRLSEFEEWSARSALALTRTEKDFLEAAVTHREEEELAEAERQRQENSMAGRARRRLWGAVAAVFVLVAVGAALLFAALTTSEPASVAFFGFVNDDGWNANLASGIDRAQTDFDFTRQDVAPTTDPPADFRLLAESGPDLIVTDSLPSLVAPDVFTDFLDVKFAVIDGEVIQSANTATVLFSNEEGGFLAGAAAA